MCSVKVRLSENRIKLSSFLFATYYVPFYMALFIDDVGSTVPILSLFAKAMKLLAVFLLVIHFLVQDWTFGRFIRFILGALVGATLLLSSGDFFWLIVILMGLISVNIHEEKIYRLSIICLTILVPLVLFLNFLGILPDILSLRSEYSATYRHSLGFAHSNCLPLALFYLFSYHVIYKQQNTRMLSMLWFLILSIVCYELCNSRTAIIGVFLIVVAFTFLKQRKMVFFKNRSMYTFGKRVIIFALMFSIIPPFLRSQGILIPLWDRFDAVFTNRTLLGAAAIDGYGIQLINFMDTSEYRSVLIWVNGINWTGVVLDNGYMYILVRYGLFAIFLLANMCAGLYKHYQYKIFAVSVLTVVLLVNLLDNDLLSYGFLPYMVIGIRNMWKLPARQTINS